MNDWRFALIEVLQGRNDLADDGFGLALGDDLVLLQEEVEVVALAVLQNGAETGRKQGQRHTDEGEQNKKTETLHARRGRQVRVEFIDVISRHGISRSACLQWAMA